jgi:hypothetical protein
MQDTYRGAAISPGQPGRPGIHAPRSTRRPPTRKGGKHGRGQAQARETGKAIPARNSRPVVTPEAIYSLREALTARQAVKAAINLVERPQRGGNELEF